MNRPHFAEIARELTESIASGRYPVGSYLPTELELRDHYQTSRHTVRAALHELQQLGLVSRRKNAGTRVESAQPRNDFRPSLASLDDLVQFGSQHLRLVQSTAEVVATGKLAKALRCTDGTRWLRISSLRVDGDRESPPVGWTDVYIDSAYTDVAETATLATGHADQFVDRGKPWPPDCGDPAGRSGDHRFGRDGSAAARGDGDGSARNRTPVSRRCR